MHAINTKQKQNPIFIKYIPAIAQFIKLNNVPAAKPSVTFVRSSMLLSLDLIQIFGNKASDNYRDTYLVDTLKVL